MTRLLYEIADEIRKDWTQQSRKGVNYAAVPYLDAMGQLLTVHEKYGADTAASIIRYFLANAGTWRGDTAKRVKAELKGMVEGVY